MFDKRRLGTGSIASGNLVKVDKVGDYIYVLLDTGYELALSKTDLDRILQELKKIQEGD